MPVLLRRALRRPVRLHAALLLVAPRRPVRLAPVLLLPVRLPVVHLLVAPLQLVLLRLALRLLVHPQPVRQRPARQRPVHLLDALQKLNIAGPVRSKSSQILGGPSIGTGRLFC